MPNNFTQNESIELLDSIQLRIDEKTYSILYSDSEYFHLKGINTLINRIIGHYSYDYLLEQENKYSSFTQILETSSINNSQIPITASKLLAASFKLDDKSGKKVKSLKIHINVRYENEFVLLAKKSRLYHNEIGFSEILRHIIQQYTKFSRAERELILYKDIYNKVLASIKKEVQVELYLPNQLVLLFQPYEFIHPLDDEGNYLFGENESGNADAVALYQIKKVVNTEKKICISDASLKTLKDMKETKFNYSNISDFASGNIIQKVQGLKMLSQLLM